MDHRRENSKGQRGEKGQIKNQNVSKVWDHFQLKLSKTLYSKDMGEYENNSPNTQPDNHQNIKQTGIILSYILLGNTF